VSTLYKLELTRDEAILLDGRVGEKAQAEINKAKDALRIAKMAEGLSESEAKMVAEIIAEARTKGILAFRYESINHCPCCDRKGGYHLVKRNTKWKRKGQPDRDSPIYFRAWNLRDSFISVKNHISIGFCETCRPRVEPLLAELLQDIECSTPKHWTEIKQRYIRHPKMQCTECGWEGHEGEMLPKLTLIGDGHYPGGCPKCPAVNTLFLTKIKSMGGHVMVPYVEPAPKPPVLEDEEDYEDE
jgi:hypothetical protein